MRKKVMWIILGVLVIGAVATGPIMSDVEQAKYRVVETYGAIEIRDYEPMIVAEASVKGNRKEAINEGFEIIADYIFGNNTSKTKVAMTAPVLQQPSEKISMTAPVIQEASGDQWTVRFVMPADYSMDTLPAPNNTAVKLQEVPARRMAVIRFSGAANEESLKQQTDALNALITEKKFTVLSSPAYAFFNPPWTLPFLRRNEVMRQIAQ
jgi:effector-binding domain-containing protein